MHTHIFIHFHIHPQERQSCGRPLSQSCLTYTGIPDRSTISSALVFRHICNAAFWNILGTIKW